MSERAEPCPDSRERDREAEGEDTYDEHKLGLTVQRKPCCVYFRCRSREGRKGRIAYTSKFEQYYG